MNVNELKTLLLTFDANLKKYFWNGSDSSYTIWVPHNENTIMADDSPESRSVIVTVHRYTKNDDDDLIYKIQSSLESKFVSTSEVLVDYELETGFFHYILDCFVSISRDSNSEEEENNEGEVKDE